MKYIVIIPDGMMDYPSEALGNKTPLEVAHTTNMDYLAENGSLGLIKTIPDGMQPGSEIGNLSIMGYGPDKYFSGRAPLEAANLGITLADDEIAFRCNLTTVLNNKMTDYSAGHISTQEAATLIQAINEKISEPDIKFFAGKSYRHLLVLKVRNINEFKKIECTPPHDIMGQDIYKYLPKGSQAKLLWRLMEQASKVLAEHPINNVRIDLKENPANAIWLWGQGTRPQLPLFKEKYGVEGAIISAVDLVNGIGKLIGLDVVNVPGITGYYDTNYLGKAEYAIKALEKKDLVFIHIEGPDEAGHNGDVKAKIACIEHIDREILGTILNHFDKKGDMRILVIPDHPTPVSLRRHTRDLVGFVMYGKNVPLDTAQNFSEKSAKEKGVKFKNGEDLLAHFINRYI